MLHLRPILLQQQRSSNPRKNRGLVSFSTKAKALNISGRLFALIVPVCFRLMFLHLHPHRPRFPPRVEAQADQTFYGQPRNAGAHASTGLASIGVPGGEACLGVRTRRTGIFLSFCLVSASTRICCWWCTSTHRQLLSHLS